MTKTEFRDALKRFGIRQAALAERLGVTPESVSRWSNGHQEVPKYAEAYLGALAEQERLRGVLQRIVGLATE